MNEKSILKSGIYSITNAVNGKVYIGSAVNTKERLRCHWRMLSRNIHDNTHIQNSWNKYGSEKFLFEVITRCPKEYLVKLEQFFIDAYRKKLGWDNLFNLAPKANSQLGVKFSQESKEKCRKASTGRTPSKETKAKISVANKLYVWTDEHRAKISATSKGRTLSLETREKISKASKGRTHTEETKAKISAKKRGCVISKEQREHLSKINTGKKMSEETKAKIAEGNRRTKGTDEYRAKMSDTMKNHPDRLAINAKCSAALKGHPTSEQTRKKISESNNGRIITQETRSKISATLRNRAHSLGVFNA